MSQSSNDRADEQGDTIELTTDERHCLLADSRRRNVLDVLADRATPVDFTDLARAVADREFDGGADPDQVERVAVSLHHVHLPKMADCGVVEYDPSTNRVERYRPMPEVSTL